MSETTDIILSIVVFLVFILAVLRFTNRLKAQQLKEREVKRRQEAREQDEALNEAEYYRNKAEEVARTRMTIDCMAMDKYDKIQRMKQELEEEDIIDV